MFRVLVANANIEQNNQYYKFDELQNCNVILTVDGVIDDISPVSMKKVFSILIFPEDMPIEKNLHKLSSSINHLKQDLRYLELTAQELDTLFIGLNINEECLGAYYLKSALYYCYYHPYSIRKLDDVFKVLERQYNLPKENIRSSMRTALKTFQILNFIPQDSILQYLQPSANSTVTPKRLLRICTKHLLYEKIKNKK